MKLIIKDRFPPETDQIFAHFSIANKSDQSAGAKGKRRSFGRDENVGGGAHLPQQPHCSSLIHPGLSCAHSLSGTVCIFSVIGSPFQIIDLTRARFVRSSAMNKTCLFPYTDRNLMPRAFFSLCSKFYS